MLIILFCVTGSKQARLHSLFSAQSPYSPPHVCYRNLSESASRAPLMKES